MENKSLAKKFLGDWSTKTIVAIAIGAALYGVLMVYGSIPVFTNTYLSSAMVVPVVVGALFGPVPSMITLLVGNCLADLIGGQLLVRLVRRQRLPRTFRRPSSCLRRRHQKRHLQSKTHDHLCSLLPCW